MVQVTNNIHMQGQDGASWPVTVELTNGHSYRADLVVCAIGVAPNADWLPQELERSGDDGGVLVNGSVQPSLCVAHPCFVAALLSYVLLLFCQMLCLYITATFVSPTHAFKSAWCRAGTCRRLWRRYGRRVTCARSGHQICSPIGSRCASGHRWPSCAVLPVQQWDFSRQSIETRCKGWSNRGLLLPRASFLAGLYSGCCSLQSLHCSFYGNPTG